MEEQGKIKNHYIPRLYLKNFATSNQKVWTYRTLVSNEKVPIWKESSLKGVAYHEHLYTRTKLGQETSTLEEWFDQEYEHPASDAIKKVISEQRLKASDWDYLIRFLAVQDLRTPARLIENLERWRRVAPQLLENATKDALRQYKNIIPDKVSEGPFSVNTDNFPVRITKFVENGQGKLKVETIIGRKLWLWGMEHVLSNTARSLHSHRWSILKPFNGLTWFTSDDPVIRLNFRSEQDYSFEGGWGSPKTEIFLPLSPIHLLYTQVGVRPPNRGTKLEQKQTKIIRKCLAEHSHRLIFSNKQDCEILKIRPRIVDNELYLSEQKGWNKWHEDQSKAEFDF